MSLVKDVVQLLGFKSSRPQLLRFNNGHLAAGILGTWIVGMGRYWDDPDAEFLQHLGAGSVIYIFAMSLFIWLIVKPYFVKEWKYKTVLTFVSLTSFPAILYAIPVERFMSVEVAAQMNVWFLLVVAAWRLGLLFFFLKVFTKLPWGYIITAALLPICVIVITLSILNLEHVVFNIMGGIRTPDANAKAYDVLLMISVTSIILFVPLLLGYLIAIRNRWLEHKKSQREARDFMK